VKRYLDLHRFILTDEKATSDFVLRGSGLEARQGDERARAQAWDRTRYARQPLGEKGMITHSAMKSSAPSLNRIIASHLPVSGRHPWVSPNSYTLAGRSFQKPLDRASYMPCRMASRLQNRRRCLRHASPRARSGFSSRRNWACGWPVGSPDHCLDGSCFCPTVMFSEAVVKQKSTISHRTRSVSCALASDNLARLADDCDYLDEAIIREAEALRSCRRLSRQSAFRPSRSRDAPEK
jgi:hypothetical protein